LPNDLEHFSPGSANVRDSYRFPKWSRKVYNELTFTASGSLSWFKSNGDGFALTVRPTFDTDDPAFAPPQQRGSRVPGSATAPPVPGEAATVRPKELCGFGRNRLWAYGVHAIINPSKRPAERRAPREDIFDANGLPRI
jgi:hypothetical protein